VLLVVMVPPVPAAPPLFVPPALVPALPATVPPAPLAPALVPPAPEAPAEPQVAPAAPDLPEAPPAPEAPHAGKHKKVIIMRHGGGDPEVIELPDMANLAEIEKSIPEIRSAKCGDGEGDGKQMVWTSPKKDGEKQKIVICVNRMEAQAAMAKDVAVRAKAMGLRSAMFGLRHARAAIEADDSLSPEKKAEALRGIDQAMAEIGKDRGEDNDSDD
jgi:hypothetical protein